MATQKIAMITALAASVSTGVFAQPGSTGGTIGQRDKSISGTSEQTPPPASTKKTFSAKPAQTACSLEKVWGNQVGDVGSSVWTITAAGAATEKGLGNAQGHATLSGHRLFIVWHTALSNGNYVVNLNPACTAGSGRTIVLGGYLAGKAWNVTFTAAQ